MDELRLINKNHEPFDGVEYHLIAIHLIAKRIAMNKRLVADAEKTIFTLPVARQFLKDEFEGRVLDCLDDFKHMDRNEIWTYLDIGDLLNGYLPASDISRLQ